jgi:hypothetical protein
MAGINLTGLINAARNVQKPISLAAVALLVLYLVFSQIVGKIQIIDQKILPEIVTWIGIITLVAVVMSISSYVLPFFPKGRAGELVVGSPIVTSPTGPARSSRTRGAAPPLPGPTTKKKSSSADSLQGGSGS